MDGLTLGVAIYAALVATITGLWVAYGIWRDRAVLDVDVVIGYAQRYPRGDALRSSPELDIDEIDSDTRLIVRARNVGRRSVVLSEGGFQTDHRKFSFMGEGLGKELPKKLGEGEKFDTWTYLLAFKERRSQELNPTLKAYWQTEAGQVYKTGLPRNLIRFFLEPLTGGGNSA